MRRNWKTLGIIFLIPVVFLIGLGAAYLLHGVQGATQTPPSPPATVIVAPPAPTPPPVVVAPATPAPPAVIVAPAATVPVSCNLSLDSHAIKAGESTTLRYTSQGATKLSVDGKPVSLSGSMVVTSSATTNYTGIAEDTKGNTASCSATLTVAAANETRLTTGPSEIDISALDPATLRLILIVLLVVFVVLALSNWWTWRVLWTVISVVLIVLLVYNLLPQLFNLSDVIVTPLTLGTIQITPLLTWFLIALMFALVAAIFVARGTAFWIFIGVLVFALFFSADFRAELSRLAGLSFTTVEGEPRVVEVAPSPRIVPIPTLCDGTRRLVVYGGAFLPATPNCHANWSIAAESPGNCVIAIGVNGPLTPVVCKYNQDVITLTSPISGWRTTGSEVWLDVTYTPKASTRTAVLFDP